MSIHILTFGLLVLFAVGGIITALAFLFSVFYDSKLDEDNFYSAGRKIRDDLLKNMKFK